MRNVTVKSGQTLFDIAIQALGLADRVFEIAQMNGLGITDTLSSGLVLNVPDPEMAQMDIIDYYKKPWCPAGGDDGQAPVPGGIGYMQIGTNFKVS